MTSISALPNELDQPSNFMDIFDDPDDIGATEYRAVYDLLDELDINAPDKAIGVLEETIAWANYMIVQLQKHYQASRGTT